MKKELSEASETPPEVLLPAYRACPAVPRYAVAFGSCAVASALAIGALAWDLLAANALFAVLAGVLSLAALQILAIRALSRSDRALSKWKRTRKAEEHLRTAIAGGSRAGTVP